MEVLTAYVRQHAHAPWRLEEVQQALEDAAVEKKSEEDSSGESETAEVPAPAADIQAIITVLRRRTRSFGHGEPESLDLHDTNLSGANLSGAYLSKAYLSAILTGAILTGAYLKAAELSEADLRAADLRAAELSGANLSGAYLSEAEHLTQEQLENTRSGDEDTKLPPDLKPPAHWNVKTDEQIEGD
jgi:hypothetical protein